MTAFEFIAANRPEHSVAMMCRVLGVSRSGFHAWTSRGPSARQIADEALTEVIADIHRGSDGTYGAPRVWAELADDHSIFVGCKRVARLMKASGLVGVSRRKFVVTTIRDRSARPAPDRVKRRFSAERPDQLWVSDITYVPTRAGWLFLAIILDVFSRRIVGWSMASHMRTSLVIDAIDMATQTRRPDIETVLHSDQGTQYTSIEYSRRLEETGLLASMGSVGDCYDNAMAESFFATLETELIDRRSFTDHDHARREIFNYIEGFYNPRRRHSALGYRSPANHERRWHTIHQPAPAA